MPYYETVLVVRQDATTAQVESIGDHYAQILTQDGGRISRREYWGLKNLAYRIRKNRKGHYLLLNHEASAQAVAEMNRQIGLSEDIIRNINIKMDDLPEEASIMMERQEERQRDGGGNRGNYAPRNAPSEGAEPKTDKVESETKPEVGSEAEVAQEKGEE